MPPADLAPHAIETEGLTRRFGEVLALADVSLTVRPGEFFALLGPSGCGKTTLLRIIAGLEVADAGQLRIGGVESLAVPAHRRPVNTVFQSYALFPHLDVGENVAFGLRMKKVPRPEIERRVGEALALVQITPLARRRPAELSGGQKQRVALARALVNEPQVLLLDEPLAALDLKLRKELQGELRALQRRLGITFLYVTHDQEEALVLSDRLAVMRDGRIEQMGDAKSLYERPRTRFVSQFLGTASLLEVSAARPVRGGFLAATALGELQVEGPLPQRATFTLAIRPEKIRLVGRPTADEAKAVDAADMPVPNRVRTRVERGSYVGAESHYELRASGQSLRVEAMNTDPRTTELRVGEEVVVDLPPGALIVLED